MSSNQAIDEILELKDVEKCEGQNVSVIGFVEKSMFFKVNNPRLRIVLSDHSGVQVGASLWGKYSSTSIGIKDLIVFKKMNVKRFGDRIELQTYYKHSSIHLILSGKSFLDPSKLSQDMNKFELDERWINKINLEFEFAKRNVCFFFRDFISHDHVFDDLEFINTTGIFELSGKVFDVFLFSECNSTDDKLDPSNQSDVAHLSSPLRSTSSWKASPSLSCTTSHAETIANFLFSILQHSCLFCAGERLIGICECNEADAIKKWSYRPLLMHIGNDTSQVTALAKNVVLQKLFHGISAEQLVSNLHLCRSKANDLVNMVVDSLDSLIMHVHGEGDGYRRMTIVMQKQDLGFQAIGNELIDLI